MNTITLQLRNFLHIASIRKNPNGLTYRHKRMDDFIASQGYKNIKTYKDFIYNRDEMYKQRVYITEKEEAQIFANYERHRKASVWTKKNSRSLQRKEDKEIEEEYEHKNLITFAKEAIKQKKGHHKFYLSSIYGIISSILTYFLFYYGKEPKKIETTRTVNIDQIQKYNIHECSKVVPEIDRKMKLYIDECRKIVNS